MTSKGIWVGSSETQKLCWKTQGHFKSAKFQPTLICFALTWKDCNIKVQLVKLLCSLTCKRTKVIVPKNNFKN